MMQLGDRDARSVGSRPVAAEAPVFIVLNVGSGKLDGEQVRATIERKFSQSARSVSIRPVTEAARLAEVAGEAVAEARARMGIVVAAGGDGTIHTVAQATLGSGCPFGVLPLGTFNYFSRAQGIPSDLEGACDVLLGTRAYEVQVGMVNEQVFLVNASLVSIPSCSKTGSMPKAASDAAVWWLWAPRSVRCSGLVGSCGST